LLAGVRFEPDRRGPAVSRHTPLAIDQPQRDLAAALSRNGISNEEFVTLQEGETRVYPLPAA